MKIAILSRSPRGYSTLRLSRAARARGHKCVVLDTMKFAISLEKKAPDLFYKGKPLSHYDAVIPRIGASVTHFGTAVVRQFEQMGVCAANSALGISHVRDKLRCLQILSRHDIGIPKTEFVRDKNDVMPAIERVGGAPVIIKLLEGTQGVGVILADTRKIAEAIIETLRSARQNVLIQKFVAESKGTDVRAFVVGDRVVAAIRRRAQGQEFRSNIHRGGKAEAITLDPLYEATAVSATQIVGLQIAGIDMLESADGPQILEVNSSPGLAGIESATQIDVAGSVVDFLSDKVAFPELDIRQRLTVSRGYGAAEIVVSTRTSLAGKSIEESGLQQMDIVVLSLKRSGKVIPNPQGTRKLRAGDRLLCFGKLEMMRDLIPRRKRRRIRRLTRQDLNQVAETDTAHRA